MEPRLVPDDWKSVLDANRRIDDAVAEYEEALRRGVRSGPTAAAVPSGTEPAQSRPAAPVRLAALRGMFTPAAGGPPARPVVVPMPGTLPPAPAAPPEQSVPLELVAAQIDKAIEQLTARQEAAGDRADRSYTTPWGETRPVMVLQEDEDGPRPNPVSDAEIRDRLQPHWRAVHQRAESLAAALAEEEQAVARRGLVGRIGARRAAWRSIKTELEQAESARAATDLIWTGEAMRAEFDRLRALADAAFAEAMKPAPDRAEMDAQMDSLQAERLCVQNLRERGVAAIGARQGESRPDALNRALQGAPAHAQG